jgi:hypothetical protein
MPLTPHHHHQPPLGQARPARSYPATTRGLSVRDVRDGAVVGDVDVESSSVLCQHCAICSRASCFPGRGVRLGRTCPACSPWSWHCPASPRGFPWGGPTSRRSGALPAMLARLLLGCENRVEIAKGGNAYGDLLGLGDGLAALLGGLVDGKGEGREGGRTMLSLVSPSFLPMSWFCQSAVLSLLPSLDMRPGTTRGMVADI